MDFRCVEQGKTRGRAGWRSRRADLILRRHQHGLDGDLVRARLEVAHRHIDGQMPENAATIVGDRHGRGDLVIDVDIDMAARQYLRRIGGVEQKRRLAIGRGIKIGGHAHVKLIAETPAAKFGAFQAKFGKRDTAVRHHKRHIGRMPAAGRKGRSLRAGRTRYRGKQRLYCRLNRLRGGATDEKRRKTTRCCGAKAGKGARRRLGRQRTDYPGNLTGGSDEDRQRACLAFCGRRGHETDRLVRHLGSERQRL
ncbi:hypothetical protein D3C71_937700 [compost metagenome]